MSINILVYGGTYEPIRQKWDNKIIKYSYKTGKQYTLEVCILFHFILIYVIFSKVTFIIFIEIKRTLIKR